jgi:hypothetical protein
MDTDEDVFSDAGSGADDDAASEEDSGADEDAASEEDSGTDEDAASDEDSGADEDAASDEDSGADEDAASDEGSSPRRIPPWKKMPRRRSVRRSGRNQTTPSRMRGKIDGKARSCSEQQPQHHQQGCNQFMFPFAF